MKYDGIICDGCGREFTSEDDVVVCPVCGTPQHRECWSMENNCVNAEKHGDDFVWSVPIWKKKEEEAKKNEAETKKENNKKTREDRIEEIINDPRFENVKFKNGENIRVCPKCGSINSEKDAVCIRCGSFLQPGTEESSFDRDGFPLTGLEMLRLYGGLDADSQIDGIPANEISTYVGGNRPGKFIRRFSLADRSGKNLSFNPAVIFFGPLWYFYRKMTKLGILFILAFSVISLLGTAVQMDDTAKNYYRAQGEVMFEFLEGKITRDEMTSKINDISAEFSETATDTWRTVAVYACDAGHIALYLFMVIKADSFYRKKIKKDIEFIRARNDNMNDYLEDLSYSGGTNIALGVVGAVLFGITSLIGSLPAFYYMYFG